MGEWAERMIERIREGVREEAAQIGQEMVDDIQQALSTSFPPPSSPGDDPHRRSGLLQQSERSEVSVEGPVIVLTVSNDAPHAGFLLAGTSKMAARPFHEHAKGRWFPIVGGRIQRAVVESGKSQTAAV